MTEENAAEATAQDEQVEATATEEVSTEEVTAEEVETKSETETEEETKQASERTKLRRRQRRDAKLNREREARVEAEKKAEYYRGLSEGSKQTEVKEDGEPKSSDYEDYDEFIDAKVEWKLAQANKATEKPKPAQEAPATDSTEPSEEFTSFKAKGLEKFGEDFTDMIEAAQNQEFAASQIMVEAMIEEDIGPEMAMHFYDNPDEAAKIAKMSPLRQVKALAALGDTLSVKEAPKKTSEAPEPITPEKDSSVRKNIDPSKETMAEYVARRAKERAAAR